MLTDAEQDQVARKKIRASKKAAAGEMIASKGTGKKAAPAAAPKLADLDEVEISYVLRSLNIVVPIWDKRIEDEAKKIIRIPKKTEIYAERKAALDHSRKEQKYVRRLVQKLYAAIGMQAPNPTTKK